MWRRHGGGGGGGGGGGVFRGSGREFCGSDGAVMMAVAEAKKAERQYSLALVNRIMIRGSS